MGRQGYREYCIQNAELTDIGASFACTRCFMSASRQMGVTLLHDTSNGFTSLNVG